MVAGLAAAPLHPPPCEPRRGPREWTGGFGRQLLAFALSPFVHQRFTMLAAKEHFSYVERLAALAERGQLVSVIDRRIPLHAIKSAIRELEAGSVRGKIVVQMP